MSAETHASRRRYLAALAGTVAVAGCSALTEQSFEAGRVVLPPAERQALGLAETGREDWTVSRDGPSGDVEVSITNRTAVYGRAAGYGGE